MNPTEFSALKLAFYDALTCDPDLTPLDTRIAWRLLHYVNGSTGYAWPSINTLAREACCSERSTQYAVRRLIQKGWFTLVPGAGGGRHMTNRYVPCLDRPRTAKKTGASGCTHDSHERVQAAEETVQCAAGNGADHCTRTPLPNPITKTLEPAHTSVALVTDDAGTSAETLEVNATADAQQRAQTRPPYPHVTTNNARQGEQAGRPRGTRTRHGERWTEGAAKGGQHKSFTVSQSPWEQRVKSFRERGFWLGFWGPRPDERGCEAPAHVLARYGYPLPPPR